MPSQANQQQIEILKEKLTRAKSIAIVDFAGTSGSEQVELRKQLKAAGAELFVTKNTLIDIAVGKGQLSEALEGMNAIMISYEDEVGGVKALFKFHKDSERLTIKSGKMGDKVLSASEVETLSQLPGKNELIGQLLSVLNGPGTGLVNVLSANTRDLVQVVKAISEKQN